MLYTPARDRHPAEAGGLVRRPPIIRSRNEASAMITLAKTALLALLTLGAAAAGADVYKWTDDGGVMQYTQSPPEDRPFTVVKQQRSPVPSSAPQGSMPSAQPEVDGGDTATPVATAATESVTEAKQHNCELARQNLDVLSTKTAILLSDPVSGERRRLSDDERQQQIRQAERDIAYFCE
jgi:hypothetical protein